MCPPRPITTFPFMLKRKATSYQTINWKLCNKVNIQTVTTKQQLYAIIQTFYTQMCPYVRYCGGSKCSWGSYSYFFCRWRIASFMTWFCIFFLSSCHKQLTPSSSYLLHLTKNIAYRSMQLTSGDSGTYKRDWKILTFLISTLTTYNKKLTFLSMSVESQL